MLSPQELGHLTDDIEKIWQELEDELLADIAQRIVKNDYTFPATAAWNKYKLEEIGVQYDYIVRQLSQTLRLSEKQVKRIIGESVQAAVDTDNLVFNAAAEAGLLESVTDTSELISKFIADGVKATNGELRNFARTYAAEANRAYEHAIDQAYLQVTNGFYTAQQASQTAIEQLARQGITSAITPSGRREHADVIVRRAVRTGTNQAALKAQEANFFAMEAQLVEVTAHYGARPSHAEWQGKIYEWTKPGKQKQTSYPDFVSATGYGTGAGLGGWNCRHSFYPFFEGLSERAYEPLNRRETERVYDLEQQQRYNERMIREWTRRQKMLEAGGCDASKEREKVKEWKRRNDDLIKANPDVLKKNYAAAQVSMADSADKYLRIQAKRNIQKAIKIDTVEQVDSIVCSELSKLFKGYVPSPLTIEDESQSTIDFRQVSPIHSRISRHISIVESSTDGHVFVENPLLAISIHERTHDLLHLMAMKMTGIEDNEVVNNLQIKIMWTNYEKLAQGVYLACFKDESYLEIKEEIMKEISDRATHTGGEFIAESMVQVLAGEKVSNLSKKVYNYLRKEWAECVNLN